MTAGLSTSTMRSQVSQIGHRDESLTPGIFRIVTDTCTAHSHTAVPIDRPDSNAPAVRIFLRAVHLVFIAAGVVMLAAIAVVSPGALVYLMFGTVVLGLVVWLVVRATRSFEPTKRCPSCAERVKRDAAICRFCGTRIRVNSPQRS